MSKLSVVIEITKCEDCPHKIGAGQLYCTHPEMMSKHTGPRPLPKTVIPNWCPLEERDEYCEKTFNIDRKL